MSGSNVGGRINGKDILAGLLLLAAAAFCGLTAWTRMKVGSPGSMGPGFFPLMISLLLAPMAALIVLRGLRTQGRAQSIVGLRALVCILSAPALFGLLVAPAGFVPAIAVTAFVASLADRRIKLVEALLLALFMTVLSTLLFIVLLQMPVPLFGPRMGR